MFDRLAARIVGLLVGLTLLAGALPAMADNIPGSASSEVPELSEKASELMIRSIKDNMRPLRDSGGAPDVSISTSGTMMGAGVGFGGETSVGLRFDYRDLDTSRLDGSLLAGSVLLGKTISDRTLVFGGLLVEELNTDTIKNDGKIENTGVGLALGMDYRVNNAFFLTGIAGYMDLDYDVSRNRGAVTGSFGAKRSFVDLSGDYMTKAGTADVLLGFGLLYVTQDNDGYRESSGDLVGGFTSDQFSGKLTARSFWGEAGRMRPYVDADALLRISGNTGLSPVLDPGDTSDWSARLGLGVQQVTGVSGFDAGIGANFGDDDFEGMDLRLKYTLRF